MHTEVLDQTDVWGVCVYIYVYVLCGRKFLIKQLCREYGLQAYMTLAKLAKQEPLLTWVIFEESVNKVNTRLQHPLAKKRMFIRNLLYPLLFQY